MKTLQEFDDMLEILNVGASLEHKGWDSTVHNLTAAKGDQVFLYVHDMATRWTWMASNVEAGTSEEEMMLGNAMCLYAGGTQTFQAADGFKGGGHFCVILYRKDHNAEAITLRPFALPGATDSPIPANVFVDAVLQVAEIDMARHPEWFKDGK